MKHFKLFILTGLTISLASFAAGMTGDETVQFVYNGDGSLHAVTNVLQGPQAEKVFNAIKDSYPNLVQPVGKLGLQPEVDAPNLSCGLQVTSHGPGGQPAPTPIYQCYISTVFPH